MDSYFNEIKNENKKYSLVNSFAKFAKKAKKSVIR